MKIEIDVERWPLAASFRITGRTFTEIDVVTVTVRDADREGCGEAAGVYYRGETASSLAKQIEAVREPIAAGVEREVLRRLLPPGGARNAVDCALWDLEAQRAGQPVWKLAGLPTPPRPLLTTYTLSGGPLSACRTGGSRPRAVRAAARRCADLARVPRRDARFSRCAARRCR